MSASHDLQGVEDKTATLRLDGSSVAAAANSSTAEADQWLRDNGQFKPSRHFKLDMITWLDPHGNSTLGTYRFIGSS